MAKIEEMIDISDIRRKISSFSLGDRVLVENEGVEEVAEISRFYKHQVQFRREDGSCFMLQNFDAAKACLLKPSGFKIHSQKMDREALLNALDGAKIET